MDIINSSPFINRQTCNSLANSCFERKSQHHQVSIGDILTVRLVDLIHECKQKKLCGSPTLQKRKTRKYRLVCECEKEKNAKEQ